MVTVTSAIVLPPPEPSYSLAPETDTPGGAHTSAAAVTPFVTGIPATPAATISTPHTVTRIRPPHTPDLMPVGLHKPGCDPVVAGLRGIQFGDCRDLVGV